MNDREKNRFSAERLNLASVHRIEDHDDLLPTEQLDPSPDDFAKEERESADWKEGLFRSHKTNERSSEPLTAIRGAQPHPATDPDKRAETS